MKLNLQLKYSVAIFILIFSVILSLSGTLLLQSRESMDEMALSSSRDMANDMLDQLKKKGETMVLISAENLTNPLYHYDMETIYEIIRAVTDQNDVIYVYVYDRTGRIIHDGTKQVELYGTVLHDDVSRKAVASEGLLIQTMEDSIDISAPIKISEKVLGGVRVGLSLKTINNDISRMSERLDNIRHQGLRQHIYAVTILSAGLFVLGLFFSVYTVRRLSRPLVKLNNATRKVSEGDFTQSVDINSGDEISELAGTFNIMVENLRRTTVSKEYMDGIIGNMSESLVVTSPDRTIKTVNKAACEMLGYDAEELKGQPLAVIFPQAEGKLDDNGLNNNFNDKNLIRNIESVYISKYGKEIPVLFSASVMQNEDEGVQDIICVAMDITTHKSAEDELKKHREHLEDLVKERTAELRQIVNAMAGREVRMAELKKVIEVLRKQLDDAGIIPEEESSKD